MAPRVLMHINTSYCVKTSLRRVGYAHVDEFGASAPPRWEAAASFIT